MLQQTQVSRVLEKFEPFLERFPSVGALAAAAEEDVLAAWSGMGYYRRARNLQAAARVVVERFGGRVPESVEELRGLPGIGRYTAGAIASIVYGRAEPIVDGNVARVLVRVEGKDVPAEEGMAWAWGRAGELAAEAGSGGRTDNVTRWRGDEVRGKGRTGGDRDSVGPGVFNEGLMELGAVVCTPRAPKCVVCPVRGECRAAAQGRQEELPRPKVRAVQKAMYCAAVLVEDKEGRVLVERRGDGGMWAGLWQAPTLESGASRPGKRAVEAWIGSPVVKIERFGHGTTHRDVSFEVWRATGAVERAGAVWRGRGEVARMALSNPMRRILLGGAAAHD